MCGFPGCVCMGGREAGRESGRSDAISLTAARHRATRARFNHHCACLYTKCTRLWLYMESLHHIASSSFFVSHSSSRGAGSFFSFIFFLYLNNIKLHIYIYLGGKKKSVENMGLLQQKAWHFSVCLFLKKRHIHDHGSHVWSQSVISLVNIWHGIHTFFQEISIYDCQQSNEQQDI